MTLEAPGFIVLYRWRLHPGTEKAFISAWSRITEILHTQRGSLGARLHQGADEIWYSYAQWPSESARDQAFSKGPVDEQATETMKSAIAERLPEIVLTPRADYLQAWKSEA